MVEQKTKDVVTEKEPLKITLELTENGSVKVLWSGGLTRVVSFGMLEDAKYAILNHYEQEAMKRQMVRSKIVKPNIIC